MVVSKENVIFVYRNGDPDSHNLASYYQQIYDLDGEQLLGIDCSDTEILPDYTTFRNEVETPILAVLPLRATWVIILGYNVPGGFYDGSDIISSTSRVSRIEHPYNKMAKSNLYNRVVFNRYDSTYGPIALIVSRIDGPTYDDAKRMIDMAHEMHNQALANGRFFFDPFSSLSTVGSGDYSDDLTDFYINMLFDLNMKVCSTTYISPYIDVVFPHLEHDSFYWGGFTDRSTESFFRSTDTERIFFYNADYDSAITMRSTAQGNFCPLALKSDYISIAGAMSNPGAEGFLRPRPFFEALYRGATLGEAYLFSNPYYDWTVAFFGDPLVKVVFYSDPLGTMSPYGARVRIPEADNNTRDPDYVDEDEVNREVSIELAEAVAHYIRKEAEASDLFYSILLSSDVGLETSLLYETLDLMRQTNSNTRFSRFYQSAQDLLIYIKQVLVPLANNQGATLLTVNDYLTWSGLKLSRILSSMISNTEEPISDSNLYPEGYWEYEYTIIDNVSEFTDFNFVLQVSDDNAFSNIIVTANSDGDRTGWYYESEENAWSAIPFTGVPSNYVGRRVQYRSPVANYLTRAEIYYFRIKQTSPVGDSSYSTSSQIIYT